MLGVILIESRSIAAAVYTIFLVVTFVICLTTLSTILKLLYTQRADQLFLQVYVSSGLVPYGSVFEILPVMHVLE